MNRRARGRVNETRYARHIAVTVDGSEPRWRAHNCLIQIVHGASRASLDQPLEPLVPLMLDQEGHAVVPLHLHAEAHHAARVVQPLPSRLLRFRWGEMEVAGRLGFLDISRRSGKQGWRPIIPMATCLRPAPVPPRPDADPPHATTTRHRRASHEPTSAQPTSHITPQSESVLRDRQLISGQPVGT